MLVNRIFPVQGVITNLFPVEAILVTCARGRSDKMDAPASQFSLEFSLLTHISRSLRNFTIYSLIVQNLVSELQDCTAAVLAQ